MTYGTGRLLRAGGVAGLTKRHRPGSISISSVSMFHTKWIVNTRGPVVSSYVDEDVVSLFTDNNGETVIIADELTTGPRVFTIHFV